MFSVETKLANLLYQISVNENTVEQSRQALCESLEFNPHKGFEAIDRFNKLGLSTLDLKAFTSDLGVYCNTDELELIVKQYDSKGLGRISIPDFFQLVLPSESETLREIALNQTQSEELSLPMKQSLARHIQLEASTQGSLLVYKKFLAEIPAFDHFLAFRTIDKRSLNFIDRNQLRYFLRSNSYEVLESDIDAILRRIDTDGDGMLSFPEFVEGISVNRVYCSNNLSPRRSSNPFANNLSPKYNSPLRLSGHEKPIVAQKDQEEHEFRIKQVKEDKNNFDNEQDKLTKENYPLQTEIENGGPQDMKNEGILTNKPDTIDEQDPEKKEDTSIIKSSPIKDSMEVNPYRNKAEPSSLKNQLFKNTDLTDFVGALRSQISLSKTLEEIKISLALQEDFTIQDCFKLIDLRNTGDISSSDMYSLLQDFGLYHSSSDVYLLLTHYSSRQNLRLNITDFEQMLTPKDNYYAHLLKERAPQSILPQDRMALFRRFTLDKIVNAFKIFIESERLAEDIRVRLFNNKNLNLLDVFRAVDKNCDSFITIEDFEHVLRDFAVYANETDLECLIDRYDKDGDKRVNYAEFIQETYPKLT